MINHLHIIWQMRAEIRRSYLQRDFLKFTAQMIKRDLRKITHRYYLIFLVNAKDRKY